MDFSKEKVIETNDSVAPDGFLDNPASLKVNHVDSDAGNEFVTNSLWKIKRSKLRKV